MLASMGQVSEKKGRRGKKYNFSQLDPTQSISPLAKAPGALSGGACRLETPPSEASKHKLRHWIPSSSSCLLTYPLPAVLGEQSASVQPLPSPPNQQKMAAQEKGGSELKKMSISQRAQWVGPFWHTTKGWTLSFPYSLKSPGKKPLCSLVLQYLDLQRTKSPLCPLKSHPLSYSGTLRSSTLELGVELVLKMA